MLEIIRNIVVILFVLGGVFFFLVGSIGLIRMPDVFSRMHATTKCDTLGAGLIFVGIIIWQGIGFLALNIFIILVFVWLTNPTAAHYIASNEYDEMQALKQKGDEA